MLRTVYVSDGLRGQFLDKHAPRLLAALGARLQLRTDLDPAYALLSMISQLVFPHIARPLVGPILGVEFDKAFAKSYSEHIATLLHAD
jgi:hypothetical protein